MKYLISLSFLLLPFLVISQKMATADSGERIILNEDGTWEVLEEDNAAPKSYTCKDVTKSVYDKVSGTSYDAIIEPIASVAEDDKSGIGIDLLKSSKTLIVIFTAIGASNCIGEDDKVNILFTDGTRAELSNNGDFNCKNQFKVYFGKNWGKKKETQYLSTKTIDIIRVWTSKGYVERTIEKDDAERLRVAFDCLK